MSSGKNIVISEQWALKEQILNPRLIYTVEEIGGVYIRLVYEYLFSSSTEHSLILFDRG